MNVFSFAAKIQIKVSCFKVFFRFFHRHNEVDKDEAPYPFLDMVNLFVCLGRPHKAVNIAWSSLVIPKATLVMAYFCEEGLDIESNRE